MTESILGLIADQGDMYHLKNGELFVTFEIERIDINKPPKVSISGFAFLSIKDFMDKIGMTIVDSFSIVTSKRTLQINRHNNIIEMKFNEEN